MKALLSQTGKQHPFDIIVIGNGIAGLLYTLKMLSLHPKTKIALLCKKTLCDSNSFYAQGGIAAAKPLAKNIEAHIQDTLKAGDGLCNEIAVREILKAAPEAIEQLKKYGVHFDKALAQEGGHSERRIYHRGDQTGEAIIKALIKKIKSLKSLEIFTYHTAINLIKDEKNNEAIGVYVLDEKTNKIHTFLSRAVILATGGAGKIYRYTTNPEIATGDGIAMAYRAGAQLKNLEFYQFHPTLLYHPKENNFLISEAVRGEGAYLRHPITGKRFMKHYAPHKMELATRDIVTRAIFNELERDNLDFVYLDIRHRSRAFLKKHFPGIYQKLSSLGIDMHRDLIPVVPAAHYLCGGISAKVNGETNIPRLYAIGEAACTGLHGANRLASNSLVEGAVMADQAATASAKWLQKPIRSQKIKPWSSKSVIDLRRASQINAHWRGLRGEMTSYAGIIRTEEGLKDLLHLIRLRHKIIEQYYWQYEITRDLIELRNIVLIAELIVRAALRRRESRGGHFREDFSK